MMSFVKDRPDGSILLRSRVLLGPWLRNTGAWAASLEHQEAPDRVFSCGAVGSRLARRCGTPTRLAKCDPWRQSLVGRGLGPETPIVIIVRQQRRPRAPRARRASTSPFRYVPLAEQYSLVPDAYPRLQYAVETVRPKMVFADDGAAYDAALALPFLDRIEKVVARNGAGGASTFADLLKSDGSAGVDAAHATVGPDTLAKIIFTSGSTANPKGVLTTHGMLCVNQAQMAAAMPVIHAPRQNPRLAAVGSCVRRQPQLQHDARERRQPVHRRWQADEGRLRGVSPQHPRTRRKPCVQRADRLCATRRRDGEGQRPQARLPRDTDLIFYAAASVTPGYLVGAREIREGGARRSAVDVLGLGHVRDGAVRDADASTRRPAGQHRRASAGGDVEAHPRRRWPLRAASQKDRMSSRGYYQEPASRRRRSTWEGFLITNDAVKFVDPNDANAGLNFRRPHLGRL